MQSDKQKDSEHKASLRKQLRVLRAGLSAQQRNDANRAIAARLEQQFWYKNSSCTAFYLASAHEASLNQSLVNSCRSAGQRITTLPVLASHANIKATEQTMRLCQWTEQTPLTQNQFGLLEPKGRRAISLLRHQLILLPLVGFDRGGNRLGMGGGYYDRLLANTTRLGRKPLLVGIAYACQESEQIPNQAWDIKLDAVLTEKALILCSKRLAGLS